MKSFSLSFRLALAIALLAPVPAVLHAQSVDDIRAVARDADISEDLAVMSKIVQAKVGLLYGEDDDLALWVHHDATWPQIADELSDSKIAAPLAHHLDGYGVVLQMQLPGVRSTLAGESDEETANDSATTLWDQVRGRLRGERATQNIESQFSQSCQQCHTAASVSVLSKIPYMQRLFNAQQGKWHVPTRDQLADALLEILAENGHNFRHLAADQKVAIAVTIKSWQHPRTASANSIDALVLSRWLDLGVTPHGGSSNQFGSQGTDASGDGNASNWHLGLELKTPIGYWGEVTNNHELAGDLHARQGRLDEAISAFDNALQTSWAEVQPGPDDEGAAPSKVEQHNHGVVRLWRKLATVHHQAGQLAEAQKYLNLATHATHELNDNAQQSPSEEPQADDLDLLNHPTKADVNRYYLDLFGVPAPNSGEAMVPARLTVSATKSLLDQVAAGEITREQFKSLASVRFTAAQDKPPSAGQ